MKRIAITGLGLVTPLGLNSTDGWSRLLNGRRAGRWLSPELIGTHFLRLPKGSPWFGAPVDMDSAGDTRLIAFAERAADEAVRQAGLDIEQLRCTACVVGTSKQDLRAIEARPGDVAKLFPSEAASRLTARFGCEGGALAPIAACATGLVSIIRGANLIREGHCTTVLAGSADASLHAGLLASYQRLGVLANPGDDPAACCRPFDVSRSGFVVGEGAGMLVLEDWEQARSRQVPILAEWVDGIYVGDPTGMTLIDETGVPLSLIIRRLLRHWDVAVDRRLGVSVHGTATPLNDLAEGRAIRRALDHSDAEPFCFGVKGAIGHLMGAAGSVELGFGVLALRDQMLPPSVNHRIADELCGIRLTWTASPARMDYLLKLSLGFGGHVAAGLIRRAE